MTANALELLQALGFQIDWEKSTLIPQQETTFLGLVLRSTVMYVPFPAITKGHEPCIGIQTMPKLTRSLSLPTRPYCGQAQFHSYSHSASPITLQQNSKVWNQPPYRKEVLQNTDNPIVVPITHGVMEQQTIHGTTTRSCCPVGCLPDRLGSHMPEAMDPRQMVFQGVSSIH